MPEEFENKIKTALKKESVVKLGKLGAISDLGPNKIGHSLATLILYIVAGFLILMIVLTFLFHSDAITISPSLGDLNENTDLLKIKADENSAKRGFITDIFKVVLLNFFLPVISAIIGYIFGSQSRNKES